MESKGNLHIKAKMLCLDTEALLDEQLQTQQLTGVQGYLLYYIWSCHPNGTYISDLHRELELATATISGLAKRLCQKGYLTASKYGRDERRKRLVLTGKELSTMAELGNVICNAEHTVYRGLSEQERDTLYCLATKALKHRFHCTAHRR